MTLTTPRLILRPWTENDAPALYRHASNPTLGQAAGWPPHTSVEESLRIIRTVFSAPETYAVVLKASGEPIGCCGLLFGPDSNIGDLPPGQAEVGYWLAEQYWGQGIIPEAVKALLAHAFTTLSLSKIWLSHFEGNNKSRRVAQKCGFSYMYTQSYQSSGASPALIYALQHPMAKAIDTN